MIPFDKNKRKVSIKALFILKSLVCLHRLLTHAYYADVRNIDLAAAVRV